MKTEWVQVLHGALPSSSAVADVPPLSTYENPANSGCDTDTRSVAVPLLPPSAPHPPTLPSGAGLAQASPAKKRKRRGIHSLPNNGASVDWLTPPSILQALGQFDLDPCAHPTQFYRTAVRMIAPPADGLSETWQGRVWLNPPYGDPIERWMSRMAAHGNGVALVPSRTDVESWFWPYVWEAATSVLFIRGRLHFHRPDGSTEGNAGHGSVLVAYGDRNSLSLCSCRIPGAFFRLKERGESFSLPAPAQEQRGGGE